MAFEKKGCEVHLEWTVPGTRHRADVAVLRPDGLWDTYEYVQSSVDNLASHIQACFEQSSVVATLTIVAAQKQILRKIEINLRTISSVQLYLDHVKFDVIDNYMKGIF